MKIDLEQIEFNFIRNYIMVNDNEVKVKLQKNLRESIWDDVTGVKFGSVFDIDFDSSDVSYETAGDEYFVTLIIPISKIKWNIMNVNKIMCTTNSVIGAPEFFDEIFRKAKKVTNNELYKDVECVMNDYKFVPEWQTPIRLLDLEIDHNDPNGVITVDLSKYDLSNYDEVNIFAQFKINVINIPDDFERSYKNDQGLAFYLMQTGSNQKEKYIMYLPGDVPENRNLIKLVRKK